MSPNEAAKNFQALLRKLRVKLDADEQAQAAPAGESTDELRLARAREALDHLVHSFMLWEATQTQAKAAVRRLQDAFVDANELRIALPHETARIVGERYPLAAERCVRLKATLQDLYRREHTLSLQSLIDAPKREARAFLESLDGMPPFVSARLFVISLAGHAAPADWKLVDLLVAHKAIPADHADPAAASAWLERQFRSGDAPAVLAALQAWSDEHGESPKFDRSIATGPTLTKELAVCEKPRKRPVKKSGKRPADRSTKPKPR
ncbi:MAG: hypothetical protein HEQ23_02460 [Tepidisphaera sp.]